MADQPSTAPILAAGTVPWRRRRGALEVAIVHRPKYDDWSWPKGKLDPGELAPVAAARETLEETGLAVQLGRALTPAAYTVLDRGGRPAQKVVAYWAAEIVGGPGTLVNEIDAVVWLDPTAAWTRLDYARDRDQLRDVVRADREGTLSTWPLVVVRHAKAVSRGNFSGKDDRKRPLDAVGRAQAEGLVPLLHAFGVRRLVSSSSVRCVDTLRPYAAARGLPLVKKDDLTEEAFAAEPHRVARQVRRLLDRGRPVAVCGHGPVLPEMLAEIGRCVPASTAPPADETGATPEPAGPGAVIGDAVDLGLSKGEILVCHVREGAHPSVVAAERHGPPAIAPA